MDAYVIRIVVLALCAFQSHSLPDVSGKLGLNATDLDWRNDFSHQSSVAGTDGYNPRAEIAESVLSLVGWTPMVYLNKILPDGVTARVAAKMEGMEPMGSVKDRTALSMVEELERTGKITPGKSKLLEVTSGNTGIGLAFVAAAKGYKLTVVMPEAYSMERRILMLALGTNLIITSKKAGIQGMIIRAEELLAEDPDLVWTRQFDTAANPGIHYVTTGPEIWQQTQGKVDIFVAGAGTGGTMTGAGTYLREQKSSVELVLLEPAESPFYSQGKAGPHGIQGISAGVPIPTMDASLLDEVVTVSTQEAIAMARRLAVEEGIFAGISSGAATVAAIKVASKPENAGKLIVTVFPSFGERYLSTPLYQEFTDAAKNLPIWDLPAADAPPATAEGADAVAVAEAVIAESSKADHKELK